MQVHAAVLVLFGLPGSGKGTFSQHFKEQYNYDHLSIGNLVRSEIEAKTPIGLCADEMLKEGRLLEESLVQTLIANQLNELAKKKSKRFIIDGFPRTEESLVFLKELLKRLDLAEDVLLIHFEAEKTTCEERILTRLICKQCGHVYNRVSYLPRVEGQCDFCSSFIRMRAYDDRNIIQKRFEDYYLHTEKTMYLAKQSFPSLAINTQPPLSECLHKYDLLYQTLHPEK